MYSICLLSGWTVERGLPTGISGVGSPTYRGEWLRGFGISPLFSEGSGSLSFRLDFRLVRPD
jgi:hypothetical protein